MDPTAERLFALLNEETVPALLSYEQWATPFDAYAYFINMAKKDLNHEDLLNFIRGTFNVDTVEEALTPSVMFKLAMDELLELFPPN